MLAPGKVLGSVVQLFTNEGIMGLGECEEPFFTVGEENLRKATMYAQDIIPSNISPAGEDDIITQPFEHINGIMHAPENPRDLAWNLTRRNWPNTACR